MKTLLNSYEMIDRSMKRIRAAQKRLSRAPILPPFSSRKINRDKSPKGRKKRQEFLKTLSRLEAIHMDLHENLRVLYFHLGAIEYHK